MHNLPSDLLQRKSRVHGNSTAGLSANYSIPGNPKRVAFIVVNTSSYQLQVGEVLINGRQPAENGFTPTYIFDRYIYGDFVTSPITVVGTQGIMQIIEVWQDGITENNQWQ